MSEEDTKEAAENIKPMSKKESKTTVEREHLEELEDGAGCVEIWEKLSEKRNDD